MNSSMSKRIVQSGARMGRNWSPLASPSAIQRCRPCGRRLSPTMNDRTDSPWPLRNGSIPATNAGVDVYPKTEAVQLAEVNHYDVPAAEEPYTPPAPEPEAAPAEEPAPAPAPEPQAAPEPAPAPEAAPQPLPKTGSNEPLIALIGVLALGAFLGLRRFSRSLS